MTQATTDTGRFESTTPLLRPAQVESLEHEATRLKSMVNAPPYVQKAVDMKTAMGELKRIEASLNSAAPKKYEGTDLDKAVKREKELREKILDGMPTAAEMRKAPPGALEKHMAWENRNKQNIEEWKNIRLRLHRSGALASQYEGSAIANLEMFRPQGGASELNMDNAFIPGKQFSLGNVDSTPFSDFELGLLQKLAPNIAAMAALLTADQRREVKAALANAQAPAEAKPEAGADLEALSVPEMRARCREAGLESGGSKEDLLQRLRDFYGHKQAA